MNKLKVIKQTKDEVYEWEAKMVELFVDDNEQLMTIDESDGETFTIVVYPDDVVQVTAG